MKRSWIVLVILASVAIEAAPNRAQRRPASAVGSQPSSKIVEVTLFKDRAYVKRRLTARLEKGAHSLAFTGVTPLADPDSLKVRASDKRNLTVMGIRTQNEYLAQSTNPELVKLQAE